MLEQKEHFHGSDLEKIEKKYGIKTEDIVSFSANVNPLGISPLLKDAIAKKIDAITTYPDREYTSLRKAIATYCECNSNNIVVGNGCTELISLFIKITAPKKTLIIGPTYSEYERDLKLFGSEINYFYLEETDDFVLDYNKLESTLNNSIDLLIICNPNNPTGGIIKPDVLSKILEHCKKNKTFVMVDETYIEFVPDVSMLTAISLCDNFDNLIVLRGTSKFFAAPGLRLGYAVTGNKEIIKDINTNKNPWMINSLAVVAGETMFLDNEYIDNTRKFILSERTKVEKVLADNPKYKIYPSFSNFILIKILDPSLSSNELFERAIKQNMMIRDCSSFHGFKDRYIRICVMNSEDNKRLLDVLR